MSDSSDFRIFKQRKPECGVGEVGDLGAPTIAA